MATRVDFMQPDTGQIRHQVRGILDSYSHEWDLLAELSQNAIDAIARENPARGHIDLEIDAHQARISISDNGVGIDPDKLAKLLSPFVTDKIDAADQIGQKGVGVTFVVFTSAHFEIETWHSNGHCKATIAGANDWLAREDDQSLLLEISEKGDAGTKRGVKITLAVADREHSLFDRTFHELVFLLRTKTALGNTAHIWGNPLNCDFMLTHVDRGGETTKQQFACNYLLPTEGLNASDDFITIEQFEAWRTESDRSDPEKRRKLKDKLVVTAGSEFKGGRTVRWWTCFVPKREAWKRLSERHGLAFSEEAGDPSEEDANQHAVVGFLGGGVFVSTKGMPTGINLELKPRGSAGYMPNFFMIIEDPALKFDIGRKFIPGRLQGVLRERGYEQFREYISSVVKYVSGSVDGPSVWERDEVFDEIDELPDLNSPKSIFIKRPNAQEATVAGMFYEQLGRGDFVDIRPLISGYKNTYDLYAKWGRRKVVIEFKYEVYGLIRDFSDERKMFAEIDVLVVWEITERDMRELSRRTWGLETIDKSVLSPTASSFPLATRRLVLDGVSSIDVVVMRKVLRPDE